MNYLVDKNTSQINIESWFDEDKHAWLERGVVCWNPCVLCKEGEEEQQGYIVEDIPEEEIDQFLMDEEEDLYYIDGKVFPREEVQISFSAIISHPDLPDQMEKWIEPSNMQIIAYQNFVVQEFSKFKAANPNDADNDELWHDWLMNAFAAADFKIELPKANNPVPAHVDYLDFDNPKVEAV